jgi:DNA-directed RNA polymerase specialized sigma24 family protein
VHYEEQRRTLERFVAERGDRLLRTAALLAGSRADGEDLLQSALERLLRHWRRIDGDPENYVRRTLYNLAADGWRRQRGAAAEGCAVRARAAG